VCRLRDTPIITFVNKLDREGREPVELLDEIESVLGVACAPVSWPIGMGQRLKGIVDLVSGKVRLFGARHGERAEAGDLLDGLDDPRLLEHVDASDLAALREEIELVQGACAPFDLELYRAGQQTPVFFGSAIHNFGVQELLDAVVAYAPPPAARAAQERTVAPDEPAFSGFVFKIQANMDPAHRDRVAFFRICSGVYERGIRARHVRLGRDQQLANATVFMAGEREGAERAVAGDIIGIHNHGTVRIGDTFTQGESLRYTGIPDFAPELFRRAQLRDPLRSKALLKGLEQLSEEGATQLFRPLGNNDLILGAVGVLQFEVAAYRLKYEYGVEASFEPVNVVTCRWVHGDDPKKLDEFQRRAEANLALDGNGELVYLAPTRVNLGLTEERWPELRFLATREH
jgi:peptide chain release factor 3